MYHDTPAWTHGSRAAPQTFASAIQDQQVAALCRPVDCTTKVPLGLVPGYIDETVYVDNIQTGWSWDPYSVTNKLLQVPSHHL